MNETLSQAEIDALILGMVNGEAPPPEIKEDLAASARKYDFRRPNKFTKDQLRTLFMINENLSRILTNFLSGYLRSNINIQIAAVEQITYEEFLVSIPSPTLLTVFQMSPLKGNAVFELSHSFTAPIIDLLFGGNGKKLGKARELTEIENRVLKKLIQKMLDNMALAWSDVFEFEAIIDTMESNPQFIQIISPNDTVAIITFTADIANNQSIINMCLPWATLKDAITNLTAQNWFATQQYADTSQSQYLYDHLEKVPVNLTACCGETQLTIKEFLQLEEGDVILLNKVVGDDMELLVEGHPKYTIQPGIIGNKIATMITGKF